MQKNMERKDTNKSRQQKRLLLCLFTGVLVWLLEVSAFYCIYQGKYDNISHVFSQIRDGIKPGKKIIRASREEHPMKSPVKKTNGQKEWLEEQAALEERIWSEEDLFWTDVRSMFGEETESLTSEEILSAEELQITFVDGMSFEDLKYFTELRSLSIMADYGAMGTADFSPVGELAALEKLDISDCSIGKDTEFLENLTSLKELYLTGCGLTDLGFLKNMQNLERASFYYNELTDIAPVAYCTNLKELSLGMNQIADIGPLQYLVNMENLGIQDNRIEDISVLKNMTKLAQLNISYNMISDLSPVSGLTKMTDFGATANMISDVTPLSGMNKLRNLALDGNEITDISPISDAVEMEYLGLSYNQIGDMSPVQGMTKLFYLSIGGNPANNIGERFITPIVSYGYNGYNMTEDEWEMGKVLAAGVFEDTLPEYSGKEGAEMEVEDYVWGDFNGDGTDDLALTCYNGSGWGNEDDSVYDMTRKIFVLLAKGEQSYEALAPIDAIGPGSGGIYGDPYEGIYCVEGRLIVQNYGGSNFRWEQTEIYQYNGKEMEQQWAMSLDNFVYTSGYDWYIDDLQNDEWYRYAIAGEWEGARKILLLSSNEETESQKREQLLEEQEQTFQEIQKEWEMELPELSSYFYEPNIDDDGYYVYEYRDTLMKCSKSPDELLAEAAEKYLEDARRLPIDLYASEEIKDNYDHLAGVALPDEFYIGKIDGTASMLSYQGYRIEEEGVVHLFEIRQPTESDWWLDENVICYDETSKTWEMN